MDLELNGKTALITGAGQGVGRGIAKVLAAEGAKIAVNDFYMERAEAVAAEIRAAGGQAIGVQTDVGNLEQVRATAHEGTSGRLDLKADPEKDPTLQKMLKVYPVGRGLGRLGRAFDPAYAVAFLASPKAAYITGQCLSVSGGFTMVS